MLVNTACDALTNSRVLNVKYDGYFRDVEVHAVGYTQDDNAIMRVWQVRGGSQSGERSGWKLLRLDDAISCGLTEEVSQAPRRGYRKNDGAMERIACQL